MESKLAGVSRPARSVQVKVDVLEAGRLDVWGGEGPPHWSSERSVPSSMSSSLSEPSSSSSASWERTKSKWEKTNKYKMLPLECVELLCGNVSECKPMRTLWMCSFAAVIIKLCKAFVFPACHRWWRRTTVTQMLLCSESNVVAANLCTRSCCDT